MKVPDWTERPPIHLLPASLLFVPAALFGSHVARAD